LHVWNAVGRRRIAALALAPGRTAHARADGHAPARVAPTLLVPPHTPFLSTPPRPQVWLRPHELRVLQHRREQDRGQQRDPDLPRCCPRRRRCQRARPSRQHLARAVAARPPARPPARLTTPWRMAAPSSAARTAPLDAACTATKDDEAAVKAFKWSMPIQNGAKWRTDFEDYGKSTTGSLMVRLKQKWKVEATFCVDIPGAWALPRRRRHASIPGAPHAYVRPPAASPPVHLATSPAPSAMPFPTPPRPPPPSPPPPKTTPRPRAAPLPSSAARAAVPPPSSPAASRRSAAPACSSAKRRTPSWCRARAAAAAAAAAVSGLARDGPARGANMGSRQQDFSASD
jgi:hypothetical protein